MGPESPDTSNSEISEAIKRLKGNKAVGIDGAPAEFLKCLKENGMKKISEICNLIYKMGSWPEDFLISIVIPLPKKDNATWCSDFRNISRIQHACKVILRVLTQRIEGKAKDYISGSQFGFRRGVGTRDAIGTLRMLIQRSLEYNNNIYVCFVDFEKAFDRGNWSKMMTILKTIGVDWRDRRLIAELYSRQEMIVRLDGREPEPCIAGRGVKQGCLVSPLPFSL